MRDEEGARRLKTNTTRRGGILKLTYQTAIQYFEVFGRLATLPS